MAILVMFVPFVKEVATKMISIRNKRVRLSDERVEVVNAMLQGIKVTKLNSYEPKYRDRIEKIRRKELSLLRQELFTWGLTLSITVMTPILATAGTFITHVLIAEGNTLTAARTFTVLLLFAALRFPINYMGRLIGKAAQAYEAERRISAFLKRDVGHGNFFLDETSSDIHQSSPVLVIEKGIFHSPFHTSQTNEGNEIPSGAPFSVNGVNLSIKKGEILACVGPVGSGKSTLINGIIGESTSSLETVLTTKGKVAYARQVPFILNGSLRDNILFGLDYNEERYNSVMDACCLWPDIAELEAGDLSEIGERGVNLSGGEQLFIFLIYPRFKTCL